jgi:hypothetical protein
MIQPMPGCSNCSILTCMTTLHYTKYWTCYVATAASIRRVRRCAAGPRPLEPYSSRYLMALPEALSTTSAPPS